MTSSETSPSPYDPWFIDDEARERWRDSFAANADSGYGLAVNVFAWQWMTLMQSEIEAGRSVRECAAETERKVLDADLFGITGFQYGCVVSLLAECWKHGDELRRWHNLKSQIGDEGERANEEGGVLNPAIVTVETREP